MAFKVHLSPPLSSKNLGTTWFSHMIQRDEDEGLAGGASLCSMRRTRVSTDIPFRSRSIIRSTLTPARSPAMTSFSMVAVIGFSMDSPHRSQGQGKMDAAVCYLCHRDPNQDTRWRFFKVRLSLTAILLRICMGHSNDAANRFEKSKVDGRMFRPEAALGIFLLFKLTVSLHFGTTVRTRSIGPMVQTLWSLIRNSHWAQPQDDGRRGRRRGTRVPPVRAMDRQCAFTHNELG